MSRYLGSSKALGPTESPFWYSIMWRNREEFTNNPLKSGDLGNWLHQNVPKLAGDFRWRFQIHESAGIKSPGTGSICSEGRIYGRDKWALILAETVNSESHPKESVIELRIPIPVSVGSHHLGRDSLEWRVSLRDVYRLRDGIRKITKGAVSALGCTSAGLVDEFIGYRANSKPLKNKQSLAYSDPAPRRHDQHRTTDPFVHFAGVRVTSSSASRLPSRRQRRAEGYESRDWRGIRMHDATPLTMDERTWSRLAENPDSHSVVTDPRDNQNVRISESFNHDEPATQLLYSEWMEPTGRTRMQTNLTNLNSVRSGSSGFMRCGDSCSVSYLYPFADSAELGSKVDSAASRDVSPMQLWLMTAWHQRYIPISIKQKSNRYLIPAAIKFLQSSEGAEVIKPHWSETVISVPQIPLERVKQACQTLKQ